MVSGEKKFHKSILQKNSISNENILNEQTFNKMQTKYQVDDQVHSERQVMS
jgi:hypothetical protein